LYLARKLKEKEKLALAFVFDLLRTRELSYALK